MVTHIERASEDFGDDVLQASLGALLELSLALRAYKECMVLVGGWVPYFLLKSFGSPDSSFSHVGSIDIDIAINPDEIDDDAYASIEKILEDRGFKSRLDKSGNPIAFSYTKTVKMSGAQGGFPVVVDFLGPELGGSGKKHRTQVVQDTFRIRKARGVDIVFAHSVALEVEARLPNGSRASSEILVADVVGSLTTKGMALGDRYKEKDAYDIYALIAYYKSGPRDVAREVLAFGDDPLIREGIGNILTAFETIESHGPAWVADFMGVVDGERNRLITGAFSEVARFREELGW